ncbi:MAG: restriction endonuclease [Planctomycetota bacterium]|nr:MAG: restriction endonuclease [Planctomycetota bacterium]
MAISKKPSPDMQKLIDAYNLLVKGIDEEAHNNDERAYGGVVRAGKGILVESIAKNIVEIAWKELGGDKGRLSLKKKVIKIPINKRYIKNIKTPEIKEYIQKNISECYYNLKTDIHVHIDNKFVIGVECKAYAENAMMKRILVDFTLLRQVYSSLSCVLFQLESQLGGDYSKISKSITLGSFPTHTLMSYFDVDLIVITLLEGERKVKRPIHKPEFFKELQPFSIVKAVEIFKGLLKEDL